MFLSLFALEKEIAKLIQGKLITISSTLTNPADPHFLVEKARLHKQGLILQLQGINTFQQTLAFKKSFVFVPQKLFHSNKGDNIYLCEVLHFKVFNVSQDTKIKPPLKHAQSLAKQQNYTQKTTNDIYTNAKYLGEVFAFSHNGAKDLLKIQTNFINKANQKAKTNKLAQKTNSTTKDLKSSFKNQSNNLVIEVPFIPEFILKIDFKAKKIYTHLPEGLTTINVSKVK